ncbi:hypothetical protein ACIQUF_13165 [Pseudomonas sp. NPDC090233]|uniref:hypothetical protein n=1 Tax=Pseudomonas sp. NPDC090233 TaxID=3364479 RepID=UPI00383B513A
MHEVFLDFECERIDGCEVLFLNPPLAGASSAEDVRAAYSYLIKPAGQASSETASVKVFKAERYGGDGILNNGGGARCGFDGIWQLKGLGPNALVGHDVDAGHGDGNLSLVTAIYETIWAEIIEAVLPYGATRTVAILDTGQEYTRQGTQKRGLLVREPAVRPAHFIRSIYFRQKRCDVLGEDAHRVKEAIHRLVDFLPGSACATPSERVPERLNRGLIELAGRYARQFAAARAKHIMHYNVSASNVSVEGSWLDLSGICLFTNFINGDRLSIDQFNSEYRPALQSIHSLCYYLGKYAVVSAEESLALWEAAAAHFGEAYTRHLRLYQASQAGFPLWLLADVEHTAAFQAFSSSLDTVLKFDDFSVTPVVNMSGWEGYARWTYRLFKALLAGCNRPSAEADLSWLSHDDAATLCTRYRQLFEEVAQAACVQHITRQNLRRCMAFNLTRLNRSHRLLHEVKDLINVIERDVESDRKASYQRLIDEAILVAMFNLGNEQTASVPFWLSKQQSIWFEPLTGMFRLEGEEHGLLTMDALFAKSTRQVSISRAINFYRGVWGVIDEEAL